MKSEHGHRDAHHEIIDHNYFDGYEAETLIHNSKDGSVPWYASQAIFGWLNFILLGWIQKYNLANNSFAVDYAVKKTIIF